MFQLTQRIRDAIDTRIAEEQARQKTAQENLSRSASARRPNSNNTNLSPGQRPRQRRHSGTPVRGPDPKEFEAEFAIGDDESDSRAGTPRVETPDAPSEVNTADGEGAEDAETKEGDNKAEGKTERSQTDKKNAKGTTAATDKGPSKEDAAAADAGSGDQVSTELPAEIKGKLRRMDKLESRYRELLKAYRVAHSRVLSIEPFEAALRENTPLTSIGEPKALTEYLNQMSLKSDMVVDELKRVTGEREDYKKKLEEAQKSAKEAWDEVTGLKREKETNTGKEAKKEEKKTPEEDEETSEEFFSFDNEVPRLEGELKEREEEIESLKSEVEKLKTDLSVTRESTEGMVQNLETSTRELVELRDTKDKLNEEIKDLKTSKQKDVDELKEKLSSAETSLDKATTEADQLKKDLKDKSDEIEKLQANVDDAANSKKVEPDAELTSQLEQAKKDKEASKKKLDVVQGLVDSLRSQLKETESTVADLKKEVNQKTEDSAQLQKVVSFVDDNLKDSAAWKTAKDNVSAGREADFEEIRKSLAPAEKTQQPETSAPVEAEPQSAAASGGAGGGKKKNNKKKKKGGKATDEPAKPAATTPMEEPTQPESTPSAELDELKQKIESLTHLLEEKEAAIDRLSSKLKGEEDMKEEIETLRDELVNLGQEHVESKDKIKELTAEKSALEETISKLEKELVELRTTNESSTADSEKMHKSLKEEFETIKIRAATLETDLSAAQQLAATRFKDLTDLRETIQKIQPELRDLRAESSELKNMKETLSNKNTELIALEAKHEDLRAELRNSKTKITERDNEVKTLNKKIRQESDSRLKAEENLTVAQSDLRSAESKKQEAIKANEKTIGDLNKAQDNLKTSRNKIREVEEQLASVTKELEGLREEISLKTAQHASAQSLMNSMRDQTSEMAMQMKEAREKCDSLEEELADAHRLLSERTREGESMRRLLNEIEGRTETKVRDLKERMEAAVEERDRAEDEASTQGRRRAREIEDLKGKVREAERALRTAEQDKEELEQSQKDWRRRRDELELLSEQSTQEVEEIRQAMSGLREQLDESEKLVRDLEKEKAELRRSVEETNNRLEKMRKSHKTLGEDVRLRGSPSGRQSSRSSMDSGSRRGLASPSGQERSASIQRSETPTGTGPGNASAIDYMYLKNVLLQFMEQKDKNYQKQLVPVLGMLLHFDRNRRDVPLILQFIRELASYEKALDEVEATEESLRATLSFANEPPKRGSVYTALITPTQPKKTPNQPRTWRSAPGIYLEDLYVQPEARGNGYGFSLLKFLAWQVLEIKGRRLEWSVLKWNEPSIKFYEAVGAKGMDDWMKMMVEGEALNRLAEGV
ncbi:Vesicle-mediated transport protein (Imh1) [Penicillium hetheringtonii]|uniref:Vesicle-mediated transport protein (Imh1) n=1 Tax=Penicillium hetheringtonii TaxID=911720 RepID=A0AAD6H0T6_9EURO|nr:Vesicle-mediated transport protein (Imh1) [Penicillium hetheringtonii]